VGCFIIGEVDFSRDKHIIIQHIKAKSQVKSTKGWGRPTGCRQLSLEAGAWEKAKMMNLGHGTSFIPGQKQVEISSATREKLKIIPCRERGATCFFCLTLGTL
jgi:hypothetical protein